MKRELLIDVEVLSPGGEERGLPVSPLIATDMPRGFHRTPRPGSGLGSVRRQQVLGQHPAEESDGIRLPDS